MTFRGGNVGKRKTLLAIMVVITALVALLASTTAPAKPTADFKVALVTDIGSLQDKSFNELANKGLIALSKMPGFQTRLYETKAASDRLPNLLAAAQSGADLVLGTGFLMFDPLDKIVPRFPNTWFAGIDVTSFLLSKQYPNYIGIQFAEHQAGYLVGYLAGLQVKREGKSQVIGAIGANNVPPILKYISGYIQGARAANKRVRTLVNFANDPTFNDAAKCKVQALNQIAKGARVIFQVAGGCGLGVHSAAKEKNVWSIGVDADQAYLGPQVLTSALKTVDVSVVNLAKLLKAYPNTKGGRDIVYTGRTGSVGLGTISPKVNPADVAAVKKVQAQLKAGKIKVVDILPQFK